MPCTRSAGNIAATCERDPPLQRAARMLNDSSLYNSDGYIAEGALEGEARRRLFADQPAGLHVSRRSLPPGLVVVEDYLPKKLRDEMCSFADGQAGRPSTVQAPEAASGEALTRLSAERVTDYIDIDELAVSTHPLMHDIFTQQVARHYGRSIEWYEKPELLRYRAGGHYSPHADAENWDAQARSWRRAIDRDFSILLYLNEGFRGGSLTFPNFGLRLKPTAGMLVAFPADHRYVHCALPVEEGQRLVLVCWAAAVGSARVGLGPPAGATLLAAT